MEGRRLTSVGLLRAGFFPFPSAIKLDSGQPWGINHYSCVREGGGITPKGARSCNLRSSAPNRQSQNVNPGLQVVNADILCLKCRKAPWKERFQRHDGGPLAPWVPGRLGCVLWVTQRPAVLAQGRPFPELYQWMKVTDSGTELVSAAGTRLSATWNLSSALSNYEKHDVH